MKKLSFLSILLSLVLLTSACAGEAAKPKQPAPKKAATTAEGMAMEGPGKYAGDRYDEAKVQQELKKWPKNLTADQVYTRLVWLLAEDYKPVIKEVKEYKPSFALSKLGNFDPNQPKSGSNDQKKTKQKNIVVLIDSSGSMAGKVDGKTKMEEAKQAVKEFAKSLEGDVRISIRAYGHKGSNQQKDKAVSCASTEELYPLSTYQEDRFVKVVDSLKPSGWTPLAAAIKAAGQDLHAAHPDDENMVYVVSDGIESCGGDPVKEAKTLHEAKVKAVVNIIGLDLDDKSQKALEEVAKAGGGEFTNVTSSEELRNRFADFLTYVGRTNEVNLWSIGNSNELYWERQRANNYILSLLGTFIQPGKFPSLIDKEYEHMNAAVQFLVEQKIIPESMGGYEGAVSKKLDKRREMLKQYQSKLYNQKMKEIDDDYARAMDLMKKIKKQEYEKAETYMP
ncbi:vWA domain-containing protein [Lihuaxuella thermophila]|uniref:von Willebrand factor type A domain-containing protein n=1 Tax=Lihuaxuella thermophila TaxID=1173111 RepID=A0A1H8BI24_9BACL|nr:VWA domain-containing protein [Lihuaxuella thermophila]SEM81547.1 von Willebrand factor type A domain-containing protein [Lihuaxuella thermophila]